MNGEQIAYPRLLDVTYKRAPKAREKEAVNLALPLDGRTPVDVAESDDDEIPEPF